MRKSRYSLYSPLWIAIAMAPLASLHAQSAAQQAPVTATAHELSNETETVTATVVKIDQKNRLVTLRRPAGKEATIKVGPEARNFDQLKVGDQVTITYQHALALELLPADAAQAGTEVEGSVTRAEKGQSPGGTAEQAVTVTAKLTAVDLKQHTVTLTGADGQPRVIEVTDPARQARLSSLKVGDMVRISYIEALAIKVTPKGK